MEDLQEFVTCAHEVESAWSSGDLAGAVNRLMAWSEVVEEKHGIEPEIEETESN